MLNRMSLQTRHRLTNAFFALLENKNYEEVTVIDIANEAQVSRRTFYRAYQGKAQLLDDYLNSILESWSLYAEHHPVKDYGDLIDLMFSFWQRFVPELTLLVNASLSTLILDKYNQVFPTYFEKFRLENKNVSWHSAVNNPIMSKYVSRLSVGALWNVFSGWLLNPDEITLHDLGELIKKESYLLG